MTNFSASTASDLLVRDVLESARSELSKTSSTKSRGQLQAELHFTSAKLGDLKLLIKFHFSSKFSPVKLCLPKVFHVYKLYQSFSPNFYLIHRKKKLTFSTSVYPVHVQGATKSKREVKRNTQTSHPVRFPIQNYKVTA
jgi:hypothetical protein